MSTMLSEPAVATAPFPSLYSQGFELPHERLGRLRETLDVSDIPALHQRMQEDGYLYLPGLLNRQEVLDARMSLCRKLDEQGHIDRRFPLIDAVAHPDTKVKFEPKMATHNPDVERVVYQGPMMDFFASFLGGPIRHFDFTWLRVYSPGLGTRCHCDSVYMGRGTQNLYTAWTPMGDVCFKQGGLMVLEGSNNHERLRETYCKSDVDSFCENRPGQRDAWAKGNGGSLGKNPVQIQESIGGRWLTTEYSAGDVMIFSIFTVHASLDNRSDRIRMSTDTRYQLASEPVDERWIGENPIAHGTAGKRGRIC